MDGNDVVADLAINNHIIISGDPGTGKTDIVRNIVKQVSNQIGGRHNTVAIVSKTHEEELHRRYGVQALVGCADDPHDSVDKMWYPYELISARSNLNFDELHPFIYVLDNFNAITKEFSKHDQSEHGSDWRLRTAVIHSAVHRRAARRAKIHTIIVGDITKDPANFFAGDYSRFFDDVGIRIATLGKGTAECEYLNQGGTPVKVTVKLK